MTITASMVKELRERTGVGMMDCKKALAEADGDLDLAAESLRKKGAAAADKKAGRIAAEGVLGFFCSDDGSRAAMVEVNSETDFVAKGDDFTGFAKDIANAVMDKNPGNMDELQSTELADGNSVEDRRKELIGKLGENMSVRRYERFEAATDHWIAYYLHGTKIGVMVEMQGGDADLGKDMAMHIAASRPVCVDADEIPQDVLDKEKEIFTAQALDSGKPPEIIEKIIGGRISKFVKEISLTGQPFVKDPDTTVGKLLQAKGAKVVRFVRLEVGEGLEKRQEDFAAEVMAQTKGA